MLRLIMRRFFLLFSFAVFYQFLAAQSATVSSWYRYLSGSIGKSMITMHLHKLDHEYYGYYYYDRTQQPIFFSGSDTAGAAGKIQLLAYIPGKQDMVETFILSFAGQDVQGEWLRDEKSKPVEVNLQEKHQAVPFDMIYAMGDAKLRPALPESPTANYFAAAVWPTGNNDAVTFLRRVIREDFGAKDSQDDIEKILLDGKKKILDGYLEENKDLHDSLFTEFPSGYNLSEDRKLLVAFQSSKLLTLASYVYAYTGGAHGNYGTTFISIDLAANKKLGLADILTPAGIKRLSPELEKEFRRQSGLKATEPLTDVGLFENKIEPNDNFYLTGKGIGFNYMPYEIGPYAMGEVSLFLPFTRLAQYLQPAAKKWITP